MRINILRISPAVCSKKMSLLVMLGLIADSLFANNGGNPTVPIKGNVPVNHYEQFMIAIAIIYGVYLLIRARRRKRNRMFNSKPYTHTDLKEADIKKSQHNY